MEIVLFEALRELEKGEPCVLATAIRTRGSTPQKVGAKMLIRKDGSTAGTLGGGCVEGNIGYRAKILLENREEPETGHYALNEGIEVRDGLVCGGSMDFFLDPLLDPHETLPLLREILAACRGERPVALATLTNVPEGSPLRIGKKLLVRENGSFIASLGDPGMDREVAGRATALLGHGSGDFLESIKGNQIFFETYASAPILVLIGAGHVNRAVAPLAKKTGFRVYVIDDRPEFVRPEFFPDAEETLADDCVKGLAQVPIRRNTSIIVATRGHKDDDRALEAAVKTQAEYVGLLGSKRKVILIFKDLLKKGIPFERIEQIHAPIGLDIHARTPEEIAVSIVAELIKSRLGGTGSSLKLDARHLARARATISRAAGEVGGSR